MRVTPYGAFGEAAIDPRCQCRQVHGNADTDGICRFCRPKVEAAQQRREEAVSKALAGFCAAVQGLSPYQQGEVLEAVYAAMFRDTADSVVNCRVCGWTGGCKPDCPVEAIGGLL